jgi:hypothetical protein
MFRPTARGGFMKFSRIAAGLYQADTETRRYVISRAGKGWVIRYWTLLETAGVKHCIGLGVEDAEDSAFVDTKALAVDIACRCDRLIQEGYGRLFTDLRPLTKALIDSYEAVAVMA